jgi:hypothetical protein
MGETGVWYGSHQEKVLSSSFGTRDKNRTAPAKTSGASFRLDDVLTFTLFLAVILLFIAVTVARYVKGVLGCQTFVAVNICQGQVRI